jgi:hypothetical protein
VVTDRDAVQLSETGPSPVSLGDSTWTAPPATGFNSLWIGDDLNIQVIRIPTGGAAQPTRLNLPFHGEGADLVLQISRARRAFG